MGFEPLVNQRLLPPTFPRYSKILERDAAMDYFQSLVVRLKATCEVTVLNSFHVILVRLKHVSIIIIHAPGTQA